MERYKQDDMHLTKLADDDPSKKKGEEAGTRGETVWGCLQVWEGLLLL